MTYQTIENKIEEMIDVFRQEFEKLSPEEKTAEQAINSLNKSCQIEILSSPSQKFHLLIKTALDQIPDKTIKNFILSSDKYIDEIEDFYNNRSSIDLREGTESTDLIIPKELSGSLKRGLAHFGRDIITGIGDQRSTQQQGIGGMMRINVKLSVWNFYGPLEAIDFTEEARRIVHEYKNSYAQTQKEKTKHKQEQIKEYEPNVIKGYGTYLYPPILCGELNPTIRDQIEGKEYDLLNENVILDEFDKNLLMITRGGLVGLQTNDSKKVDNILTVIMSTALLMGIPLHMHKNSELASLSFDKNTHRVSGSQLSQSSLRTQMFSYRYKGDSFSSSTVRHQISIKDLQMILDEAKRIWKNEDLLDGLKLILGAYTYLDGDEFSQSFILSWTIIEKYMYKLWIKKLQSSKISNSRMTQLSSWDVSRITEILHIDKIISDDDYHDIMNLRGLRNNLFHDGHGVTSKQAQNCYELAHHITLKDTNISNTSLKPKRILTF